MENRKDTTLIYAKPELSSYLLNIELLRNLEVLLLIKHHGIVQQHRQGTRVMSTGDTSRERTVVDFYVHPIWLFLEKCSYFIYLLMSLYFLCILVCKGLWTSKWSDMKKLAVRVCFCLACMPSAIKIVPDVSVNIWNNTQGLGKVSLLYVCWIVN